MTDSGLAAFFRHSTVYAFGNVLNRAGAFLLLPLYTHLLHLDQYGALEMFWTTSSVLGSILSAGLAHATLRFYFEYEELADRRRVVSTCILTTVLYATPFVFVVHFLNRPIARFVFGDESYAQGLNVLYALVVVELLRQIGLAYLRAREYSGLYVGVCFIQLVLQVAANVYTVGVLGWGVIGVLWGNLVSVVAGTLFVLAVVFKECGWGFDVAKMKAIFSYSYPFLLSAIFSVLLQNLDRVILRAFFSLEAVGLYALAYKFGSLLQELLMEPFNRSFGAYRFKIMHEADAPQVLARLYLYLMTAATLMGLGISLFTPDVLRLMTVPEFWSAGALVPWIVLSFLIAGACYTFQTGFLYRKQTRSTVHITLASGGAGALLNVLLIPPLGAMGAALASIGGRLVEAVVTYFVSQKHYPVPYDNLRVLRALAAAAILVGAGAMLTESPLPSSIASHAALVGLFPVVLVATGTVSRSEVERLWGLAVARLGRRWAA